MRQAVIPVCLAFAFAGCSAAPPAQGLAGATARCVPLSQVAGRRVAGPDAVDFELGSGVIYRNRLQGCPGLQRLGATATVSIASGGEGGRLCAGDRIRVFDPVEARATGVSAQPACVLGDFQLLPAAAAN